MCNRFKMSNHIFDYELSANELHVLTVLHSIYSNSYRHNVITIKQSTIAQKCGFKTSETVARIICKLTRKGLIKSVSRHIKRNGDYGTYHYTLLLPQEQGNYFSVPRAIIGKLNSIQMRVYLYICKCICTKTKECWNSYNDISNALHVKRSSIIATIKELVALKVINKIKIYKKDGSFSDNHYSLCDVVNVIKKYYIKKKESRLLRSLLSQNTALNVQICKTFKFLHTYYGTSASICQLLFFVIRGSPLKQGSFIIPTLYYQREKILRYIYQHSSRYISYSIFMFEVLN